jgi:hypothetical protein
MKYGDQKMYRTFEEFEREELRRADGLSCAMEDMLNDMFAEELDFEAKGSRRTEEDDDEG